MMNTYPEFSHLISKYLGLRDLPGAHLARRLGVDTSTVTRWSNGDTRPKSPELVIQIADLLGITGAERSRLLQSVGYGVGYLDRSEEKSEPDGETPSPFSLPHRGVTSIWQDYPATYRQTEIRQMVNWIQVGASGIVLGPAGSGVSNLLRFFCNRPDVLADNLPTAQSAILPIWVELQSMAEPVATTLYRLMLRGILEAAPLAPDLLPTELLQSCQAHVSHTDLVDLQTTLFAVLDHGRSSQIRVVIVFDRMDQLGGNLQMQVGNALKAIRDNFRQTVLFIIGMRMAPNPLEPIYALGNLGRLLSSQICTVGCFTEQDSRFAIQQRTDSHAVKPSEADIQHFFRLSGGYSTLLKATTLWWQAQKTDVQQLDTQQPSIQQPNLPQAEWLEFLCQETSIQFRLHEIWDCFSMQEQMAVHLLIRRAEQSPVDLQMAEVPQSVWARLAQLGICRQHQNRWVLAIELFRGMQQ